MLRRAAGSPFAVDSKLATLCTAFDTAAGATSSLATAFSFGRVKYVDSFPWAQDAKGFQSGGQSGGWWSEKWLGAEAPRWRNGWRAIGCAQKRFGRSKLSCQKEGGTSEGQV